MAAFVGWRRSGSVWVRASGALDLWFHGNSLFNDVPALVAAALPDATVASRIVGGAKTADLTAELAAEMPPPDPGADSWDVMIEWVDDINDFGADGQDAYDHAVAYVTAAHALGRLVALCTCIDTTEFDPPDARAGYRDDFNALLRADAAGADMLIDLEADPAFNAALNAAAGPNYDGGGIHPSAQGKARMAELIVEAFS
jgi:hypothetical protein